MDLGRGYGQRLLRHLYRLRLKQYNSKHKNTHRMRRFNAELCHNIRWVFLYFGFVAVCLIRNGLRVDKTISVRLYGTQSLTSIIFNASSAVNSPLRYLSRATAAGSRQSKYFSKDMPFGSFSNVHVVRSYRLYILCLVRS